jgi:hypothetical protein
VTRPLHHLVGFVVYFICSAALNGGCQGSSSESGDERDDRTKSRDGNEDSDDGNAARGGGDSYMGDDPNSGCEERLEPVAHAGQLEVVGDGTPESCTEDALHAAVRAVNDADEGGTVSFDCGGEHTIVLERSLYITSTTILDGEGKITLSGDGKVRVIELDHYVDFVIQQITIRDGFVAAGSEDESGAGLLHPWFGTLKVIDCVFEDNHSASVDHDVGGGAIYAGGLTDAIISGTTFSNNSGSTGGGILSRSTNLLVVDSVFYANAATSWAEDGQYGNGGGLYIDRMWLDEPRDFSICGSVFDSNHATVHGSAFFSYNLEGKRAVFDRCTFRNNEMDGSPGGGTGTVYHEGVPLVLVGSTFSDNSTGAHAGGLFLGGGTDAEVSNCTFVDNSTPGNAGGLWAGNGDVEVSHCTFAGNRADYAPAIFKGSSGSVRLTDSVFSDNGTDNEFSAVACHETFGDGGGNVQWPATKNNDNDDTPCASSVLFADPLLEPLDDRGGPTETMALGDDSPAIDHAVSCEGWDQRGTPRDSPCDSGAYEHTP